MNETISLGEEEELPILVINPKELTDQDLDDINMSTYIKDKCNISNESRHVRRWPLNKGY